MWEMYLLIKQTNMAIPPINHIYASRSFYIFAYKGEESEDIFIYSIHTRYAFLLFLFLLVYVFYILTKFLSSMTPLSLSAQKNINRSSYLFPPHIMLLTTQPADILFSSHHQALLRKAGKEQVLHSLHTTSPPPII